MNAINIMKFRDVMAGHLAELFVSHRADYTYATDHGHTPESLAQKCTELAMWNSLNVNSAHVRRTCASLKIEPSKVGITKFFWEGR